TRLQGDRSSDVCSSDLLILLLALCALLFFLGLGTLGLTDRDEGSNAEAAREMVQSGDWLTPTLNGAPRFAKPILIYWLIACSYQIGRASCRERVYVAQG